MRAPRLTGWAAALALLLSALPGAALAAVPSGDTLPSAGTQAADARTAPVADTRQGRVQGSSVAGADRFAGIPYAAPPVGSLRWKPPAPPAAWNGVRPATAFGSQCPQQTGGSEDCLSLNVYRPQNRPSVGLPVMVWLHGGAYVSGAGSEYDPTPLVTGGGVLVVTINYRLGMLGALALPGLDAEAPATGSGAYSLLDQQAALRWVRQNIRGFGGDPGNVTVFGESAGATYACQQVVSPLAKGLFHAAIAQSGCALPTTPMARAQSFGTAVAAQLGCASDLACLRAASPDQINSAAATVGGSPNATQLASIPAAGGGVLPRGFGDALRAGQYNHVPLALGSNLDEGRGFVHSGAYGDPPTDQASYVAALTRTATLSSGIPAADIAQEYPLSAYPSPAEAFSAVLGDSSFSCRTLNANRLAKGRLPVHAYEFTDPDAPSLFGGSSLGATHGSELAYLFRMPGTAQLTQAQQTLSRQMIGYWTSFARNHTPMASGTPPWPRFTGSRPPIQNLAPDAIGPVSSTAFAAEHHCAFWNPAI
ncbi:carboxylesterase/lipase family protein [Streptomyces sp. NPDC091271]|uniref:carboxylesterase/lipase family protein n=1 Tax=Streptomyces sp. NPDC091271 TaxID=3365980 RepID=UPI0037F2ACA9